MFREESDEMSGDGVVVLDATERSLSQDWGESSSDEEGPVLTIPNEAMPLYVSSLICNLDSEIARFLKLGLTWKDTTGHPAWHRGQWAD